VKAKFAVTIDAFFLFLQNCTPKYFHKFCFFFPFFHQFLCCAFELWSLWFVIPACMCFKLWSRLWFKLRQLSLFYFYFFLFIWVPNAAHRVETVAMAIFERPLSLCLFFSGLSILSSFLSFSFLTFIFTQKLFLNWFHFYFF